MKQNVGRTDKAIRVLVGIAGLALGYFLSPWFYLVAVAGFGTALFGFCGLYTLLGINTTCPIEKIKGKDGTQTANEEVKS
jgi:hypothetical protein